MSDDIQIPLLENLIQKGQTEDLPAQALDENPDIDFEVGETEHHSNQADFPTAGSSDEFSYETNSRELIIDEEIRTILDKHMDLAYEEIIRLLHQKTS